MLEFDQRRGAGYGRIHQFMFRTHDNKHPADGIGYSPSTSLLLTPYHGSSEEREANLHPAMMSFVEHFSYSQQRRLGIAALLGMDVSVHEVARVADASPHEVAIAFTRAVRLGLMNEQRESRYVFVHTSVCDALVASLDPHESLAAHARAAQILTGSVPDRVQRRVSHAFAAAQRSIEDAAIAVRIAREAATILQAADDFEQAATILGQAIDLHDSAALPGAVAELVVEHAEAVLTCGHLAEARPLFHRAAQQAEAEEDIRSLARAAIGLGGVWVREHRLSEEAERVTALQRRALATLSSDASVLRVRLSTRLAAENVYRGGPLEDVVEAVDTARKTGDARALAEALSLYHHALLTPAHTHTRLGVANELVAIASVANDNLLSLMGLCWRAADLFMLGDPTANIALTELRLRAETLRCRSVLFIVQAIEVMLMIRAGRFSQAEQAASACYALGTEAGDADAMAYYGAHLAAIRLFQGREAELTDMAVAVAASPVVTERDQAFATAAALFALRQGDTHPARAVLERLRRHGIDSVVPTSSWLLTMHGVIEIAAALQDEQIAEAAYQALLPYTDLPIMASLAVVCLGSVHRPLAVAALVCGNVDQAIEHFVAAVAANERLGHRPAAIQSRAELALALLQRAKSEDAQHGHLLIKQAITEAKALGMDGLVSRWQEAVAAIAKSKDGTDCSLVTITQAPQGGWRVVLGHHVATVPDLVGLRYLARLVTAPNQEIAAAALVLDQGTGAFATRKQDMMDQEAIVTIRQRIRELRQQAMLTPTEQDELDSLIHELARATGLGRRVRAFADVPERARTAVRKAVKRAIEQVLVANPIVGEHLATRVETGTVCRYRGPAVSKSNTANKRP